MKLTKKLLAFLLTAAMAVSLLPTTLAAGQTEAVAAFEPMGTVAKAEPEVLTQEDYAAIDALFAEIEANEAKPAMKNSPQEKKTDAAYNMILASGNYVEGSIERKGNVIVWDTTEGISCIYDPQMLEKKANMVAPEEPLADGAYNEPAATKGGSPAGTQVYLVGPYYGYDDSFTDFYTNLAQTVAAKIGDTDGYTLYSGSAATIDAVAAAVSNGAVVFFDSHGSTDYQNGDDWVSGASNSYFCLNSSTGMTSADYADGALYGSGWAYVNGETISNHMTSNSPAGMVWMAMCFSMATNALCNPLRARGVEVVYGYSQSVTFGGEYLFSDAFWDSFLAGNSVSAAISTMKSTWGQWDISPQISNYYGWQSVPSEGFYVCNTIADARNYYAAFPVVVSDEDAHPGQRYYNSNWGADSLQTVYSTYTLGTKPVQDNGESGLNDQEWEMLLLTNRERMRIGVHPLTSFPALQQFSGIRTTELFSVFDHVRPNGTQWYTVATDNGLSYSYMGENIAGGYDLPSAVVAGWMNSSSHRENILDSEFMHLGVGYEYNSSSYYGKYWNQLFYTDYPCGSYSSIDLILPATVNLNHTIDQMKITAVLTCSCGRKTYLPVSTEMTNYKQGFMGKQTVEVDVLGQYTSFTITPNALGFSDVPSNAWYVDAVQYVLDNALMNGVGNGRFGSDSPMTRAMLVTVLWRYSGEPYGGTNHFYDVPGGQWYTEAVAWAANNGVVTGVAEGRFNPNGNVTREQMATILYRYAKSMGLNVSASASLSTFADGYSVSGWAADAMRWCVAEGIIGGTNGRLMPQGNATRAQVAAILMRFIENVVLG